MWDCFIGNGTVILFLITFNVAIKSDGLEEWEEKCETHCLVEKKQDCKTACIIYIF